MTRRGAGYCGGMSWLVTSIVLSVVLTVVLNVGLKMFRSAGPRDTTPMIEPRLTEPRLTEPTWPAPGETRTSERRVRVWMPWKGMIVGSVLLTILLNLVLRIA